MFELEDFDLDDEVFLNTQMPIINKSPIKTSKSTQVPISFEDNNESFLNVSNSVYESSFLQNIELRSEPSTEQNKNICSLSNQVTQNIFMTEQESNSTKLVNECQSSNDKLHFDDCFDSDDEAFFNTPNILNELDNSLKTNDYSAEMNLNSNNNESVTSFKCENHKSISTISNIKSSNKTSNKGLLNTTVTSVKAATPKCAPRKFPGPAGLLSENIDIYSEDPLHLESLDMSINVNENDKNEENLCTQANDSSFSSSPYQQFLSDFFTTDVNILLDKYNVAWIKQKLLPYTASGRFFTDKIPFFVSVIKEIDCLSPDPTVILADKTGYIRGTIHREVWNQFSCQLKIGTVLVLSKVGISCQKIVKSFTLNITSDHLIAIYSFSIENTEEVIVTRTTELRNEDIVNEAIRHNIFNIENLNKNPHSEIRSRMNALNNLKLHNISLENDSQQLNTNYQISNNTNNTSNQLTPIKNLFKPKTPVAQKLFKNYSNNLLEEPPAKRTKNEQFITNTESNDSKNEMSIIQNIFDGINEDEMFNDFCC